MVPVGKVCILAVRIQRHGGGVGGHGGGVGVVVFLIRRLSRGVGGVGFGPLRCYVHQGFLDAVSTSDRPLRQFHLAFRAGYYGILSASFA